MSNQHTRAMTPAAHLTRPRLHIGGEDIAGEGESMAVINPGTEEVVAEFAGASGAQIQAAIAAARRAYDSEVWSGLSGSARGEMLRRLMAYLIAQRERLIDLAVREAGCPVSSGTMAAQVNAPLQHGLEVIDLFLKLPESRKIRCHSPSGLRPAAGAFRACGGTYRLASWRRSRPTTSPSTQTSGRCCPR